MTTQHINPLDLEVSTAVTAAVTHLDQLACYLKRSEFQSAEMDLFAVMNSIIAAVHELAAEYLKQKELLETETIQASVLRHQLKIYPKQITDQIALAVNAARFSNAAEVNDLNVKRQTTDASISQLEQSLKQLEMDNNLLIPDRDEACHLHDDLVNHINHTMSTKSSMQIILNETRDHICKTNQEIIDLQDGMQELKEEMNKERTTARQHKKRLKKLICEAELALQAQEQVTSHKKLEADQLFSNMTSLSNRLQELTVGTTELSMLIHQLETEEIAVSRTLEKAMSEVANVKNNSCKLNENLAREAALFIRKKSQLDDRMAEIDLTIKGQLDSIHILEEQSTRLLSIMQEKSKVQEKDEVQLRNQKNIVQKQKDLLAMASNSAAQLHHDTNALELSLTELSKSHTVVVESMKKVAEECRNHLGKERQERLQLEANLEETEREVDFLQSDTKGIQDRCRQCIIESKKEHQVLTQNGYELQSAIKTSHNNIQQMKEDLQNTKQQLKDTQQKSTEQIQTMKREMSEMKMASEGTSVVINCQQPDYDIQQLEFEQHTAFYENTKKALVVMKNKKLGLEDAVRNTKATIRELNNTQPGLREQLKNVQKVSLEQLSENMSHLQTLEKEIFTVDSKVAKTSAANEHFAKAIAETEAELQTAIEQRRMNDELCQQLIAEINNCKRRLQEEWVNEELIRKHVEVRDSSTLNGLDVLRLDTGGREVIVTSVTDRLESELSVLAHFLDSIARQRPPC